ncbi:MAG: hypothetical protein SFT93_04270 [Rickettsiaceae bacterium]|nr:hypothetical protein [Rickettsiaceae bacterium]
MSSPRRRGSRENVIPSKEGIQELYILDSRLRGNDKKGCGNDKKGCGNDKKGCGNDKKGCGNDKKGCGNDSDFVIHLRFTCHPLKGGDPGNMSSHVENGDPGIIYSRFPPPRE